MHSATSVWQYSEKKSDKRTKGWSLHRNEIFSAQSVWKSVRYWMTCTCIWKKFPEKKKKKKTRQYMLQFHEREKKSKSKANRDRQWNCERRLPDEQKTVSIKGAQHLVWHPASQKEESSHPPDVFVVLFVWMSPRELPHGKHTSGISSNTCAGQS